MRYAVIDVETTGGKADRERITEIGIVITDGENILEEYSSLVNPERPIPHFITRLTGISDEMVSTAPKFYEIAKDIVEMTKHCVFVAHNVRFDYEFVRHEFKRLGYTYKRRQLCTVRLSRKAFPHFGRYGLKKLTDRLQIQLENHHRALDDAKAAAEILKRCLVTKEKEAEKMIYRGLKEAKLPQTISLELLESLPEECGVYYMHDKNGTVIYVGKSINISKRILEHFADQTRKGDKIRELIHDITFTITGSELAAMLLENDEIKRLSPRLNRALRNRDYPYCAEVLQDEHGYTYLSIAKNKKQIHTDIYFTSLRAAKGILFATSTEFELCKRLNGIDNSSGACFDHRLGYCKGACVQVEPTEHYNQRVDDAIQYLSRPFEQSMSIIDAGRNQDEKTIIVIDQGMFQGFGFLEKDQSISNLDDSKEYITKMQHNKDAVRIIRSYLDKKNSLTIIHH